MFKFISLRSTQSQVNSSGYFPLLVISPNVNSSVQNNILLKYPCSISEKSSPISSGTDSGQVFAVPNWPASAPSINSDLPGLNTPIYHPRTNGFLNQLGQTTNDNGLDGLLVGSTTFTTPQENTYFKFRYMATVSGSWKVCLYTTDDNQQNYALAYKNSNSQVSLIKITDFVNIPAGYIIHWYADYYGNTAPYPG